MGKTRDGRGLSINKNGADLLGATHKHKTTLQMFAGNCRDSTGKSNFFKVNSVQKICTKCYGVHILKFEILQMT